MGCTEPIAVAYAAAIAREQIGILPEKIEICVSANIIKNVKSVVVPNTGGLRGLAAAAAAGIIAGVSERELEVIAGVHEEQYGEIADYLSQAEFTVSESDSGLIFDILLTVRAKGHSAKCRISGFHTNVVYVEKDGEVLKKLEPCEGGEKHTADRRLLSVEDIIAFADAVSIEDVREVLERQISYNMAIAEEGMHGEYGACIGQVLMSAYGDTVYMRAKAYAAAGSDARMNGCSLPVVINSGSGNQGITASVPVVIYARDLGVSEELMYRALIVSNLITIHLKTGIGRLSAYCGAVSAGCGAGAGICYLYGGRLEQISHTIVNALAIDSGIVCDGAKSSCAAKIASAVDAGLLGMQMYQCGRQFYRGDGIVAGGVEKTICNIGRLASCGMAETDKEIIRIMVSDTQS